MTQSTSTPRLGPFELLGTLGRGGMGEVWRGIHPGDGVQVAVKVITGQFATDPNYQEGFRREVEAVAGMSHPGITTIYDFGVVSPESGDSAPSLAPGSPWFAMELATRGALTDLLPLVDWPTLRWVLVEVLDALAHAHARGVVHRDLKPQNVLVTDDPSGRVKLKLTDFGVAIAQRHDVTMRTANLGGGLAAGTPFYMPPEQFEARWREMGPWSDLYSLGCMAWELCCGRPPFTGFSVIELALKHLRDDPPAFTPLFPVPSGIEKWLRRLLYKSPIARYQRAADAAWALAAIDTFGASQRGPQLDPDRGKRRVSSGVRTLPLELREVTGTRDQPAAAAGGTLFHGWLQGVTRPDTSPTDLDTLSPEEIEELRRRPRTSDIIRADAPPTPEDWRTPFDLELPAPLAGAGIGLFGLREIPFIGRSSERDQIWRAFCRVAHSDRPEAILISGPVGCGKSRLAEWISQRAHELGAATVFRTSFGPIPAPSQGLPRMLATQMQCSGLSGNELVARVRSVVGQRISDPEALEIDVASIAAIVQTLDSGSSSPVMRFASERERYQAVVRYWQVLAVERPLIVWLDDVHYGADGLGLVQYVLNGQPDEKLPVLFLLTCSDELLDQRALEHELLTSLAGHESVGSLTISPLEERDQVRLLQQLVRLSTSLAEALVQRVEGKPLFAVQMVGELIAAGALHQGADGFALDDDHRGALPDDIFQLWLRRTRDESGPTDAGTALDLQLAAALGLHVDRREWECAARHARLTIGPETADRLISRGLAQRSDHGWAFVNSVVWEAIVRDAKERGNWSALNRAAAAMVGELYPDTFGEDTERLARYLLEGGEVRSASSKLISAARQWRELGNYRRSAWLLDERDRLALDPASMVQEGLAALVLRSQLAETSGELQRAIALANHVLDHPDAEAYPATVADALANRATSQMHLAQLAEANADYALSRELAERIGDSERTLRALLGLAQVARRSAKLDEASALLQDAVERASNEGNPTLEVAALSQLVLLLVVRGESARVLEASDRLLKLSRMVGSRGGQITALNSRGEALRQLQQYEAAHDAYREALALLEAIRHVGRHAPRYNIGMLHLLRGNVHEAAKMFEEIYAATDERHWIAVAVRAALLSVRAEQRDLQRFDALLEFVQAAVQQDRYIDKDLALCCEWAADKLATESETRERAIACYRLALKQLQQLGDMTRAGQVAAKLGQLVRLEQS